jgi:hypothetical protein
VEDVVAEHEGGGLVADVLGPMTNASASPFGSGCTA